MEPGADIVSVRNATAARLRRVGKAIRKFFGPFAPAETVEPCAATRPARAACCVWYGRATFCLYLPEPCSTSASPPPG